MILSKELERRRSVLVVEDQEINRDILGMILEDSYDVLYAENGVEALAAIREHIDRLSIVLLDLRMPVMDGFEVLEYIRDNEQMKQIPVIVLTAEKSAELRALQLGAADFITKPFDMHEIILARVQRIIELSEGRRLIRAAERDPLTHLFNRGFFFEYAEQILRFQPDRRMDALALNIDRFHSVNELNGWEFGDSLLRLIADEITVFLSQTGGIASRVEADQFFVYCPRQEDYGPLLQQIQTGIDTLSNRSTIHLRMGVSPGTAELSLSTLFDRARTACNMLRGSYKSHLMIYDETIHQQDLYDQRLINDLSEAVAQRQLQVYYQPKYCIQCDPPRLRSAEALIRWKHPELGMISPGAFIPLFERNGLIHIVDRYVWETAAAQIAAWRDRFGLTLPVSVNLSRADVFEPMLEADLTDLVERNGLSVRDLKLEVTESACTDDAEQLVAVIRHLRDRGFEIEMDDFGSGYSSLNMLSSLPIDVLKMDMKFIQDITENKKSFRLVELILDIAAYLDVPVVAEGVETEEQLNLLRSADCQLVQGYYFSPPLPPDRFEALIRKECELTKEAP